jgi:hypothetical protein
MTSEMAAAAAPLVCDLTGAPDTAEERLAEYGRLFAQALTGRDRTDERVRLRFRADDGVEAWVRDLAAREKACCAFLDFAVGTGGDEVWLDVSVTASVTDPVMARASLDVFYDAPDTVAGGVAGMVDRLAEGGVETTINETGTVIEYRRADA